MANTVLITGASSGIGEKFAVKFAQGGYNLVIVARNKEKLTEMKEELENLYSIKVHIFGLDLSKANEIELLANELKTKQIQIHTLINNAGFGLFGEFIETDLNQELNMIDLNIRSLTHLTKIFLKDMVAQNDGRILNVASTAAFQPGPLMAVYYATKAYVLSFTEALENELKNTNVTVSALCPGATDTGFQKRADLGQSKLFKRGVMDVDTVVNIAYKQFIDGDTIIIPGFKNKLLAKTVSLLPRKVVTSMVRSVQDRDK